MTEKRKWHKGPPPHIGWWNASTVKDDTAWRWWDGTQWSKATYPEAWPRIVLSTARASSGHDRIIWWTDYYPKNARVPRVDPRKVAK